MFEKGIDGFQIKVFALIFMTLDHIHYAFIDVLNVPLIFTILGRIAAPLFIFRVTEGMRYTRSREKYMFRLWIGSVFMGIVNPIIDTMFPLASGGILTPNIFSTLFIICQLIYGTNKIKEYYKKKQVGKLIGATLFTLLPFISSVIMFLLVGLAENDAVRRLLRVIMVAIPSIIFTEGGFVLVFLGIGFYLFGKTKQKLSIFYLIFALAILLLNSGGIQWFMILALPFLLLYNHEKGRGMKYFFYLYYPLHLYLLVIISYFVAK